MQIPASLLYVINVALFKLLELVLMSIMISDTVTALNKFAHTYSTSSGTSYLLQSGHAFSYNPHTPVPTPADTVNANHTQSHTIAG